MRGGRRKRPLCVEGETGMKTFFRRSGFVRVLFFLWIACVFLKPDPAQAFLFRRSKAAAPAETQVAKPAAEAKEVAPRRHWWQWRRRQPESKPVVEPVPPPQKEVAEQPPKRRWWQWRKKQPESKPVVEPVPPPQKEIAEQPPKRRWWQWRRRQPESRPVVEPVPPPQKDVAEKPPKRHWWQRRERKPEAEKKVEKPVTQQEEKTATRWWKRPFRRSAEKAPKARVVAQARDLRYHMRIPDKTFEREMLDLFAMRRKNLEQMVFLKELAAEKNQALAELNKRQFESFSMKPDVMYEYDTTNRAIYVLGPVAARRGTAAADAKRKLHLQFVKEDQVRLFVTLNTAKNLVLEQIRMLGLMQMEKQAEADRISEALEARFAVRSDRNYLYEPQTMRLNELHSAPTREDMFQPEVLIQAPSPTR